MNNTRKSIIRIALFATGWIGGLLVATCLLLGDYVATGVAAVVTLGVASILSFLLDE